MGVFRSQTPRALRERNLPYRHSNYACKTVVMIAKNDGTFPFVMAKNAITSSKMMPQVLPLIHFHELLKNIAFDKYLSSDF